MYNKSLNKLLLLLDIELEFEDEWKNLKKKKT